MEKRGNRDRRHFESYFKPKQKYRLSPFCTVVRLKRNAMRKRKSLFTRYPVISHGAEYLVMGNLMRRDILTYKAPPQNEGYDLICIHPNPPEERKANPRSS